HEAADVELRRARQVTNSTTELLSALKDAETAQRGFLIAGGENYLIPYNVAIANLPGIRNRLRAVLEGEPQTQAQRSNLPELETLVDSRIFELGSTIDIRRTAGFDAARQVVLSGEGKDLMDGIRARCAAIVEISDREVNAALANANKEESRLSFIATGGSALLLV